MKKFYGKKFVATALAAINNYAAYAQSLGAIVPYDIKVTVATTFTE